MKKWVFMILIILGILFFWFQIRPAIARNRCYAYVMLKVEEPGDISYFEANNYYRRCLVQWGLKAEDLVGIPK